MSRCSDFIEAIVHKKWSNLQTQLQFIRQLSFQSSPYLPTPQYIVIINVALSITIICKLHFLSIDRGFCQPKTS